MHPLLSDARLGPRVAKVVGAAATAAQRELAARALIPFTGPETWLALYQLWALGGPPYAELAGRTAAELPGPPIFAALADPLVPGPALDFMARRRIGRADELTVLVRHPQVSAGTLALVARCGPTRACEAIAAAHPRLAVAPMIIAALARNPCCSPAAVHAALELGVREQVPGLRGLLHALLSGHVSKDTSEQHQARQLAAIGSPAGHDLEPAPDLPGLPDSPDSPAEPDLTGLPDSPGIPGMPGMPGMPAEPVAGPPPAPAVAAVAPMRVAPGVGVVLDPATPLPLAMSLLCRLRRPDLRRVAGARRLPAPLVAAARRRLGPE